MSNADNGAGQSRPHRRSKPTSKITDPSNIASFQLSSHAEAQFRATHPPSTPTTQHSTPEPSDDGSGPESSDVHRGIPSSRMATPAALTDVEEVNEAENIAVGRRRKTRSSKSLRLFFLSFIDCCFFMLGSRLAVSEDHTNVQSIESTSLDSHERRDGKTLDIDAFWGPQYRPQDKDGKPARQFKRDCLVKKCG